MSGFKNILLGVFIVLFAVAILVFSGIIKVGKETTTQADVTLTLWGTFPADILDPYIVKYNVISPAIQIVYAQKNKASFRQELLEAIANGQGPDMVIISNENFLLDRNKFYITPFTVYPERLFADTFIDGAGVFLQNTGLLAYPLAVDPLVLYYNKDLLAAGGLLYPPKTWSGVNDTVARFTKKDARGITQSAIALGETSNIPLFKKILSLFLLQSGTPIVQYSKLENRYNVVLNNRTATTDMDAVSPQEQALLYYQSFANPANALYTWNKKLDDAKKSFIGGKTALYIGSASELFDIQSQNPNLNFDVSLVPQPDAALRPITYGDIYGIAILNTSRNLPAALSAMATLTDASFADAFTKLVSLAPARKDLLQIQQDNKYAAVFFEEARNAFTWPDGDPLITDQAFRDMIRVSASGALSIGQALYETQNQLQSTIR